MKFNIISAQIKTIKADAKQNAGEDYVEAIVKMWEPIPRGAQVHTVLFFLEPVEIEFYRSVIEGTGAVKFPLEYSAEYQIIEDLKPHKTKTDDGAVREGIHTSMRVLVKTDYETKLPLESGRAIAERIVDQMMYIVPLNNEPSTYTAPNPPVVTSSDTPPVVVAEVLNA
jgi:hypothetical protein